MLIGANRRHEAKHLGAYTSFHHCRRHSADLDVGCFCKLGHFLGVLKVNFMKQFLGGEHRRVCCYSINLLPTRPVHAWCQVRKTQRRTREHPKVQDDRNLIVSGYIDHESNRAHSYRLCAELSDVHTLQGRQRRGEIA